LETEKNNKIQFSGKGRISKPIKGIIEEVIKGSGFYGSN